VRSCRIAGCRTRKATPPTIRPCCSARIKERCCRSAGSRPGHKGYALALLVEALTAGLAGFGRADPKEGWGATLFVQVLDPRAFGGRDALLRQMDFIVQACHDATPRPGARACGCRASGRWHRTAKAWRTASRCIRRSCRPSRRGRKKLGVAIPAGSA
jgi:L-lactate dehydrogenase